MEKFVVSARKYRPQNFSTVVGQSHITTTLKNAINNNQLAHAFLFCGPRGVGKTTCARILAKTINCENRTTEAEACNTCNSCKSFDNGTSLNIHELDAASNNSVDDIRSLVEQVRFAPQAGNYKVYIVDEVHMLSASAFNAFLKTLEEPPPYAIFILATTEKHKILPTILSRCQIFDFKRISLADTIEHLQEICEKENIQSEKAGLHVIAQKSEGCLRDALSILDKIVSFTNGQINYQNTLEHLNILDEDYFFKMMDYMQQQQLADAMLLFDEINQKGFEGDTLLDGLAEFVRNILVSKDAKSAALLEVAEDFKKKYVATAEQVSAGWLIAALNILNDCTINFKQARNKRLHLEMAIIKLTFLKQAVELLGNEEISKIKITDSSKAVAFKNLPVIHFKEVATKPSIKKSEPEAKLFVEQKKLIPAEEKKIKPDPEPEVKGSFGSLKKIREELTQKNLSGKTGLRPCSDEELQKAWDKYIDKLILQKNHSAVSNFKLAVLKTVDDNCAEIIVETPFHQKFIEAERFHLIDHLQQFFNNRLFTYQVTIVEKEETSVAEKPLSTREQYLKLAEQYPYIKELKERLRLELDY